RVARVARRYRPAGGPGRRTGRRSGVPPRPHLLHRRVVRLLPATVLHLLPRGGSRHRYRTAGQGDHLTPAVILVTLPSLSTPGDAVTTAIREAGSSPASRIP